MFLAKCLRCILISTLVGPNCGLWLSFCCASSWSLAVVVRDSQKLECCCLCSGFVFATLALCFAMGRSEWPKAPVFDCGQISERYPDDSRAPRAKRTRRLVASNQQAEMSTNVPAKLLPSARVRRLPDDSAVQCQGGRSSGPCGRPLVVHSNEKCCSVCAML